MLQTTTTAVIVTAMILISGRLYVNVNEKVSHALMNF
jgi:hypothetical protein